MKCWKLPSERSPIAVIGMALVLLSIITIGCSSRETQVLQVQLEADTPKIGTESPDMASARDIIEQRAKALGITQVAVQLRPPRGILVELPLLDDPQPVIRTLSGVGLLEFVDGGSAPLQEGQYINTSLGAPAETDLAAVSPSLRPVTGKAYQTLLSNGHMISSDPNFSASPMPYLSVALNQEGTKLFAQLTRSNLGKYMPVTIDKRVITSPMIREVITDGRLAIQSRNSDELKRISAQLKYGTLPIPLRIVDKQTVMKESQQIIGADGLQVPAIILGLSFLTGIYLVRRRSSSRAKGFAQEGKRLEMAANQVPRTRKNPGLAAVLSFVWCGAGQIYNGEVGKGITLALLVPGVLIAAAVMGTAASMEARGIDGMMTTQLTVLAVGLGIAFVLWVYGIMDAYRTAKD